MSVVASGFINSGANEIEVPLNQAFNLSILLSRRRCVKMIPTAADYVAGCFGGLTRK
jgi:hypothetical protein